ncbi:HAUS augmin-like complex subunit 6 [Alosa sapidissima]|uniref:HAUS augmin-like complex subunit 6 n=1 Tax=Alosa sapidissima TaxID=34773 RepID=UPI001C090DDF|nr:HAUS augmin-like complex subunit 6 [Alosa sapidissima]
MALNQKESAKYLWAFLLSLGFKAEGNKRHVVLGETMFDKPNKEAFYIVIHFLMEKLNPARTHEDFRHCYPVLDRKQDAEFRKLTLARLQEISNETGGSFPKVLASHLLSPCGPKFINIMLGLTKHVMLEEMKSFRTDGSWVPAAVAVPASSLEMAQKRLQVARSRHIAAIVARDRLNWERQLRIKSWEKSVRALMAENAKYEELLESLEASDEQNGGLVQEKVLKVRALWQEVGKVLSSLREKQGIMDRVLRGDVDQYTLDGADMKLRVPAGLQERMDKMADQTSRGSRCDSTQPSLLHLLDLLKEALATLNEERCRVLGPTAELRAEAHSEGPTTQVDGEALRQHASRIAQAQEDLNRLRSRMSTEDIPQTKSAIKDAEASWDRKWTELLKNSVLSSVVSADPGVDVLPAMTALSFEPTPEDLVRQSVLFRHPPTSTDPEVKIPQSRQNLVEEMVTKQAEDHDGFRNIPSSAEQSSDEELDSVPVETPMMPCVLESPRAVTPVQPAPEQPPQKTPLVSILKDKTKPANAQTKKSAVKKKAEILDLEFDNLAEQFAQAVTTNPQDQEDSEGGMGLEHLLSNMIEPLSARRQLPRTPESLIADVRTSWRKAVEDGVTQKVRPSGKFPDSFTGLFTPYSEASRSNVNPDVSSLSASDAPVSTTMPLHTPSGHTATTASVPRSPTLRQQREAVPFLMSFDSSHVESLTSRSANEGFDFSIANETIPELSSGDSLLGNDSLLSNNSQDPSQEVEELEDGPGEELVLPQVASPLEGDKVSSLLSARLRLQSILEKTSFVGATDQDLLGFSPCAAQGTPHRGSKGQGTGDWDAPQQVFSLDLDQLESPSPPRQGDMHLPNLLTFSPVDQL